MTEYLKGKLLAGSREEVANTLAAIPVPSIEVTAREEISRLRCVHGKLTSNGLGVDIIQAFADEIRVDVEKLIDFMVNHSVFRNHTYLTSPYVVRDLFNDDKNITDAGARLDNLGTQAAALLFQPSTTWSRAGNSVFRFNIMHSPISGGRSKQLRVPVIMLGNDMLDTIIKHDGSNGTILPLLHDTMGIACHDYIHTSFLYYVKTHAPEGLQAWDDQLQGGKSIWRENIIFNYNYEVLASVGHRLIMQRLYEKHPEFKENIINMIPNFGNKVSALCHSIRKTEPDGDRLAQRMERWLMTNYMRFAYHVLHPDEPALAWVRKKYPFIDSDLNIHNGTGLVSVLNAHDGVPGKDTGDRDITFREWLSEYVKLLTPVIEKRKYYSDKAGKLQRGHNGNAPSAGLGY